MRRQFVPELEALRGVLAVHVILCHWYLIAILNFVNLGSAGGGWKRVVADILYALFSAQPALLVFFILSGLALGFQLQNTPVNSIGSYVVYLVRRVLRISPAMLTAILVSYLLAWWIDHKPPALEHLWKHALFLEWSLNLALWSLSAEMAISILFPFMYWVFQRANAAAHVVILIALTSLCLWFDMPRFEPFLAYFYAGLLIGKYAEPIAASLSRPAFLAIALLGLAAYFVVPQFPLFGSGGLNHWQGWLPMALPATTIIVAVVFVAREGRLGRFLRLPAVRFWGRISYGIYLFHLPVLLFFCVNIIDMNAPTIWHALFWGVLALIPAVLFTTLCAIPNYFWVERPFTYWGRKFNERWTAYETARRTDRLASSS